MENKQSVGEFIRQIRNEKELSLRKLSEISGVSFSHLSKIERGEFHPTKETLKSLSESLTIDYNNLLILSGYPTEEIKERYASAILGSATGSEKSHYSRYILDTFVSKLEKDKSYYENLYNLINITQKNEDDIELKRYRKWQIVIDKFEEMDWEPSRALKVVEHIDQLDDLVQMTNDMLEELTNELEELKKDRYDLEKRQKELSDKLTEAEEKLLNRKKR